MNKVPQETEWFHRCFGCWHYWYADQMTATACPMCGSLSTSAIEVSKRCSDLARAIAEPPVLVPATLAKPLPGSPKEESHE